MLNWLMVILVCGGRWYSDASRLGSVLDALHAASPVSALVEGGQRGADCLAREWAKSRGIPVRTFAPDWHRHGRAAGPIRNRRMIVEGEPEIVIAFPGGKGTQNMVATARQHHVEVLLVDSGATP